MGGLGVDFAAVFSCHWNECMYVRAIAGRESILDALEHTSKLD